MERSSSAHSVPQMSPSSYKGTIHKAHKAHTAGHGRLNHGARNLSHGKNLNKLTKQHSGHGGDGSTLPRSHSKTKITSPSTSPQAEHIKRNSSTLSFQRTSSKANVKRNSSNLSLLRNGSSNQLNKTGKPESRHSQPQKDVKAQASNKFSIGDEGNDDDWTEESASQSPNVTRQSSLKTKAHPAETSLPGPQEQNGVSSQYLPQSPPLSPHSPPDSSTHRAPPQTASNNRRQHPPDQDVQITSRLLNRHHTTAAPQTSSISATATPVGTHTPPLIQHNHSHTPNSHDSPSPRDPSLPENGVSRFLHSSSTGSSSGSGSAGYGTPDQVTQLHTALNQLHASPHSRNVTFHPQSQKHTRSSSSQSVEAGFEPARRVKSASVLNPRQGSTNGSNFAGSPLSRENSNDRRGKRELKSYTIPSNPVPSRRTGGNTQLKLDLQRSRSTIEVQAGPPSSLLGSVASTTQLHQLQQAGVGGGFNGFGPRGSNGGTEVGRKGIGSQIGQTTIALLPAEERQAKQWEVAGGEMGAVRRWRNLVVEGVQRVRGENKKARREQMGREDLTSKKSSVERGRDRGRNGRPVVSAAAFIPPRSSTEQNGTRERTSIGNTPKPIRPTSSAEPHAPDRVQRESNPNSKPKPKDDQPPTNPKRAIKDLHDTKETPESKSLPHRDKERDKDKGHVRFEVGSASGTTHDFADGDGDGEGEGDFVEIPNPTSAHNAGNGFGGGGGAGAGIWYPDDEAVVTDLLRRMWEGDGARTIVQD
ncbi:hypothetical protein MMC09_003267 [Bachmanniomyces sp. S44760]|nr:hypothetical protein [Bachmanniomyces sp. S44760]